MAGPDSRERESVAALYARRHRASIHRVKASEGHRVYIRDGRAPKPRSEIISRVMSANRGENTGPELAVRRELTRRGVRGYRIHRSDIPGRPDISFGVPRVAIFVNGCYWHRCPHCRLPLPKTHASFWLRKLETNVRRDAENSASLEERGWISLTIRECEIRGDVAKAVRKIQRVVSAARRRPARPPRGLAPELDGR